MEREALAKPGLQRKMETVCVYVCVVLLRLLSALKAQGRLGRLLDKIVLQAP